VSSLRTLRSKNVTPFRRIDRVIRFAGLVSFAGVLASSCAVSPVRTSGLYTAASQEGPSQTAYIPPNGRGPVVVVLSGATGPRLYGNMSAQCNERLRKNILVLERRADKAENKIGKN
jgi:hypothetical protein